MKQYFKSLFVFIPLAVMLVRCKEEYIPPLTEKNIKLLVVEGFLNRGQGATTIRLSRTTNLSDTATIRKETAAQVVVESESGTRFNLTESIAGTYSIAQLNLSNNVKYRLRIKTRDGKEYASDYSSVRYTPPVDSISWEREAKGVRLYTHTHDPQNATKYYQWEFDETWEFHSSFISNLKYVLSNGIPITVIYKYPNQMVDTTIYKCWKTVSSTSIIIGSSEKLISDVIFLPFNFIPENSEQISVLYSVNLKQHALSHEKYLFLERMKKNTEQLGSLFDAQPTQLSGNIHCLTDPNEIVIGFVEISEEQTKRKFIYNSEVANWNYRTGCYEITIDNQRDSIAKYGGGMTPTLPSEIDPFGNIKKFNATWESCVDCTIGGRSNKKPSFWP